MIKNIITSVVTSVIIVVLVLSASIKTSAPETQTDPSVLGGTETILAKLQGGVQVGQGNSGTIYSLIKSGTANILANTSIAASSTGRAYIRIPRTGGFGGVRAGDLVRVMQKASTTIYAQFLVTGVTASSSVNDLIDVSLFNFSGAAAVPGTIATYGSSTPYQIFRSVAY